MTMRVRPHAFVGGRSWILNFTKMPMLLSRSVRVFFLCCATFLEFWFYLFFIISICCWLQNLELMWVSIIKKLINKDHCDQIGDLSFNVYINKKNRIWAQKN